MGGGGKGFLGPLLQRQYYDRPPFTTSPTLDKAFAYLRLLRKLDAKRTMKLAGVCTRTHWVVASDGQGGEETKVCGIACLVADPCGSLRAGICSKILHSLISLWPQAEHHIMRIEALAVVAGLLHFSHLFQMHQSGMVH